MAQDVVDFRMLFESAPGLFLVLDADLCIVAVSDAYNAATETTREQMLGRGIFDVFPDNPDDAEATGEDNLRGSLMRVLEKRQPDSMAVQKYSIQLADGSFEARYWSPVNTPILGADGTLIYIVHKVEDVTEYIRSAGDATSAERNAATERMEAEILRRSAELRDTNELLRAASTAKNDFLSRMSHELRTPLNAIGGFSELLSLDMTDPEQTEWARSIQRAGEHMLALVDDVLDIARIEAGRLAMSVEAVSVSDTLRAALELTRPLADRRNITVEQPGADGGDAYVMADHQRLKQVLINLLSNAIKYNREAGTVRVEITSPAAQQLRIAVSDTGPGIPETALEKLFVPFERLDAESRGIQGTGLGLALSRSLLESMGATIGVSSTEGVGTRFWVDLRVTAAPVAQAPGEPAHAAQLTPLDYGTPKKVLYIEDQPMNIRYVEAVLRRRPSVELLPAMMGQLGVELAREHQPDLILLDMHLPDLTGAEVLDLLHAQPETVAIPTVILSADATDASRQALKQHAATDYVTKPIRVQQLLDLLDRYLVDQIDPQPV